MTALTKYTWYVSKTSKAQRKHISLHFCSDNMWTPTLQIIFCTFVYYRLFTKFNMHQKHVYMHNYDRCRNLKRLFWKTLSDFENCCLERIHASRINRRCGMIVNQTTLHKNEKTSCVCISCWSHESSHFQLRFRVCSYVELLEFMWMVECSQQV